MGRGRKKRPANQPAASTAAPTARAPRHAARAHGTAIVASLNAYDAAGVGPRLAHWQGSGAGVNTLLQYHAPLIRQRSRDIARNNPIATRAIDNLVASLVGSGIVPHSQSDDREFRKAIEGAWRIWASECDPTRASNFYGLEAVMVRAMMEGGESLGRFRNRLPSDGLMVPLQLQVMEPEQLDAGRDTLATTGGNRVSRGIEFDEIGAPVAYWLHREHPGENTGRTGLNSSVRVPASEIIHMYEPLRPGQVGGLPWLTAAMVQLRELDQYNDAEVVRKKSAAMLMGFIETSDPAGPLPGDDGGVSDVAGSGDDEVGVEVAEPGSITKLLPGEKVSFNEPADVGGSYDPFITWNLRFIAGAARQTYEQLSGDYSKVTYSSARQAILEFRRSVTMAQRNLVVHQLCRPVWERFVRAAIVSGAVRIRGGAARFLAEPHDFLKVKWVAPGWQWIDPLKEVQADIAAIGAKLVSRKSVIAERRGEDIDDVDEEIAEDSDATGSVSKPGASEDSRRANEDEDDEEAEDAEAV